MTTKKTVTCLLVAAIGVGTLAMAGLSVQSEERSTYEVPDDAIGKQVKLYIKPTSFGGANQEGALLTDSMNGADRSVFGTLIAISKEWITISIRTGNPVNGKPTEDFVSFERDAIYAIRISSTAFNR